MAKRYRFTDRDGKRYTWTAAQLEDTLLESEDWDRKAAKVKALKPGERMRVKGETLERLRTNPSRTATIKPGAEAAKTARRALELRQRLPAGSRPQGRDTLRMAKRIAEGKPVSESAARRFFTLWQKRRDDASAKGSTASDGGVMLTWDLRGGDAFARQVNRAAPVKPAAKRKRNPSSSRAKRPTVSMLEGAGVELGPLREIVFEAPDGKRYRMHWGGAQPVLWWNPEHRILAAVNGGDAPPRRKVDPFTLPAKSVRVYEAFHGRDVTGARTQALPAGAFHKLGRAVSIAYRSHKRSGGGDGRMRTWEHEFAPSDVLWGQNKSGRSLLAVTGPRLTVNDRGIVY